LDVHPAERMANEQVRRWNLDHPQQSAKLIGHLVG
jgi:hypothetical protein